MLNQLAVLNKLQFKFNLKVQIIEFDLVFSKPLAMLIDRSVFEHKQLLSMAVSVRQKKHFLIRMASRTLDESREKGFMCIIDSLICQWIVNGLLGQIEKASNAYRVK